MPTAVPAEEDDDEVDDAVDDADGATERADEQDVEQHDRDAVVEHALALDEHEEPSWDAESRNTATTATGSVARSTRRTGAPRRAVSRGHRLSVMPTSAAAMSSATTASTTIGSRLRRNARVGSPSAASKTRTGKQQEHDGVLERLVVERALEADRLAAQPARKPTRTSTTVNGGARARRRGRA
jgi:hypothetical protein